MGSILEWEENIFLGLKALYKRLVERPKDRDRTLVRARLEPMRQELFLLARMVAGRSVPLVETPHNVLCDDGHLFLPPQFSVAESMAANEMLFRLKTLLGALALRQGGLPQGGAPVADQIETWSAEFPCLPALIDLVCSQLPPANNLWEIVGQPRIGGGTDETGPRDNKNNLSTMVAEQQEVVTEIEGRGQIDVKVKDDPGDQPVEAEMPIHTFEKAETLEEYTGLDRKTDDEDELEEHEEALRSVDMTQVMRSRERPRSIYRADMVMEGVSLEAGSDGPGQGIPYPEWDYQKQRHKPNWCFVRQQLLVEGDTTWAVDTALRHRGVILDLRKKMAAMATQTQQTKRQPHGPELDIDAVVRARIDQKTGHAPDERFYIQRQRKLHELAALIVLDQSYSTDAWMDNARVLDTIRETVFCVGEVLDEFIEDFAIAGFSSNTRRQCDFDVIKNFGEPWRIARPRLGSLQAHGYTRIGPALRHAQEMLMRQPAERRVIFLLTDGRPSDYDRYEGEYGIRDVRKANETGLKHGIHTHAFAIEKRAREQFPRMFARQNYDIVIHPRALVNSMCGAFARLKLVS